MRRGQDTRGTTTDAQYRDWFNADVDKREPDKCWPWLGRMASNRSGVEYGKFAYRGSDLGAHVAALILRGVEVPKGAVVMHTCDNPPCVNPAHLRVGTQKENREDAARKGRTAKGERNGMVKHPERSYFHRMTPEERVSGERHGMARLTSEEVAAIRRRFTGKRGELSALGREYGVSRVQVRRIVDGRAWASTSGDGCAPGGDLTE